VSLLQARQGFKVAKEFIDKLVSGISVVWISEDLHEISWKYWLNKSKEKLSLVDCSSFVIMEKENINTAFSFDRHFLTAGKDLT
jgi:predicted nucleic acid-binding protein